MPHCFSLTRKGEKETATLQSVDDAMCAHFGTIPNPKEWYKNWYSTIGLGLAVGHSLQKLKEFWPDKSEIIDWLDENYTSDAWREWK